MLSKSNFCTLFDLSYFTRGIALYESLLNNTLHFHLYILAMDEVCFKFLQQMNLRNATIISLAEFEDRKLLEIKSSRSKGEYCWTCTPSLLLYCFEEYELSMCTYLDADIYFFSDPQIMLDELDVFDKSILITEHRYTPSYDQSMTSGIYCVQFLSARNDAIGQGVLKWWRDKCIDWCYARYEDGKFGDQKYLDDWLDRFSGVHVLDNIGGGMAPWNIQQYKPLEGSDQWESDRGIVFTPCFYHFHDMKIIGDNYLDFGNYQLHPDVIKLIYVPYVQKLLDIRDNLLRQGYSIPYFDREADRSLIFQLKLLKRTFKRCNNYFRKDNILNL